MFKKYTSMKEQFTIYKFNFLGHCVTWRLVIGCNTPSYWSPMRRRHASHKARARWLCELNELSIIDVLSSNIWLATDHTKPRTDDLMSSWCGYAIININWNNFWFSYGNKHKTIFLKGLFKFNYIYFYIYVKLKLM